MDLVAELESMPYWQTSSAKDLSVSGKQGAMKLQNFDEEALRSFLLTFRFLIQDNEPTSIREIWTLIKDHGTDDRLWARVNGRRWMINDFLDRETWPVPGGGELSFREIKLTFLYGKYAHRNPKYRERLARWRQFGDQYALLKLHFTLALRVIVKCAIEIAQAIRNPDQSDESTGRAPELEGFPDDIKDRASIRLVADGVHKDKVAFDSIRRRILLMRELNQFLFNLGRQEGKNWSSMNTATEGMRDPEGALLGGDVEYRGARLSVGGKEIDPDRAIQFAIGFLNDWRISVRISSSTLQPEFVELDADEPFDRVTETILKHHSKVFDGWLLSEEEVARKAQAVFGDAGEKARVESV